MKSNVFKIMIEDTVHNSRLLLIQTYVSLRNCSVYTIIWCIPYPVSFYVFRDCQSCNLWSIVLKFVINVLIFCLLCCWYQWEFNSLSDPHTSNHCPIPWCVFLVICNYWLYTSQAAAYTQPKPIYVHRCW